MVVPLVLCVVFGVSPYHRLVMMVGRAGSEYTVDTSLVAMPCRRGSLVRASSVQ